MERIKKLFADPGEYICRVIESCRTWDHLENAYRWGTDVILFIGDHVARTEKKNAATAAISYKQSVLQAIKDCFVKQRARIEDVPGTEFINIREVPEHVSICRTCSGTGYLTEPAYHECSICKGNGRVNVTTTVRTIITPFRAAD